MAVRFDSNENSLIIDGFENGIADSPFQGIADEKNVNVISVPGEASVNFATSSLTSPVIGATVVDSLNANIIGFSGGASGLENGMAIVFSAVGGLTGVAANTPYWTRSCAGTPTASCGLYSDYLQTAAVTIGGAATGSPTFTSYNIGGANGNMSSIQHFAFSKDNNAYWGVDSLGQVWSNLKTTASGFWSYTGNLVPSSGNTNGNGLAYYQSSTGVGYLFVFHNSSVDYTKTATGAFGWNYQWDLFAGTVGTYNATPTAKLNTAVGVQNTHQALVGQDNTVYYCDSNYVGSFFEKPTQVFDPQTIATYTPNKQALTLPAIDQATCLTELGTNLLVGGQRYLIYPWDRVSTSFTYPIFLAESVVSKMVTVNTNAFIFAGNRGRIYITNGSQVQLYKKIPDHISGTVEPYFIWGGVCSTKNQIYFSVSVKTNGGTAISQYGGVWAIDMDTKAIRLTNKLSYGTYAGFATALIPILPTSLGASNPAGTGMYIGWNSGASTYGIDGTVSTPYTGSQATIDSDLIPIGTYDKPKDFTRVEYRLTKPMVSGESITLNYRLDFSQAWTPIFSDSTIGNFSKSKEVNFKNAQWLQLQAVLNSTASSPSYTRLKEMRIKGLISQ